MTTLIIGLACIVGLTASSVSGDTWQRVIVTTVIYGAVAALLLMVVDLPSHRHRVARQNNSASRDRDEPQEHP